MKIWKFQYGLTAQEHVDFNEHYYRKIPDGKRQMLKFRLMFPVTSLVFLLLAIVRDSDITLFITQAVLLGIFAFVWWFSIQPVMLAIYKRRLKNPKDPANSLIDKTGETTFDFENGFIHSVDEKEELKVRFDSITAVYEGKNAYYLYYTKAKAFVLPYRLFESSEKMVEFYQLLHGTFPMA